MSGLETRGLRRSHPGAGDERREVLRGVDLRLEPGENVALIGRSGCGKTTLLRALLLLDSPGPEDAGEILLDGCGPSSGRCSTCPRTPPPPSTRAAQCWRR